MKATTNKITDLFDNIFIKSNGRIKDYVFYCSSSFPDRIEKYKGVKVYYSDLIEKDIVYYCKRLHIVHIKGTPYWHNFELECN